VNTILGFPWAVARGIFRLIRDPLPGSVKGHLNGPEIASAASTAVTAGVAALLAAFVAEPGRWLVDVDVPTTAAVAAGASFLLRLVQRYSQNGPRPVVMAGVDGKLSTKPGDVTVGTNADSGLSVAPAGPPGSALTPAMRAMLSNIAAILAADPASLMEALGANNVGGPPPVFIKPAGEPWKGTIPPPASVPGP
jgi:hypothetical protein